MAPDLSHDAWAQIRHDYEHTDRPVEDICAEHGISSGTLRDRMRRWGWTRRRPPIPDEGPPAPVASFDPVPPQLPAAPQIETATPCVPALPQAAAGAGAPGEADPAAIVPRLQSAVARVLPAIEATVATLAAQPSHPREMERAARMLAALTRTLRELNSLLSEHQSRAPAARHCDYDMPEDIDQFRYDLARRIRLFVASRTGKTDGGAEPQGT